MEATLVAENLPQFCPTTNLYRCSDGRYLLITAPNYDAQPAPGLGIDLPIRRSHIPAQVDVFLSDENATVLDADGDPANGMTPLARYPGLATHTEALQQLGYTLQSPDPIS